MKLPFSLFDWRQFYLYDIKMAKEEKFYALYRTKIWTSDRRNLSTSADYVRLLSKFVPELKNHKV